MLTLPLILAAASAGLIGGLHCIGMCGALSVMLSKQNKQNQQNHSTKKIIPIVPVVGMISEKKSSSTKHIFLLHTGRLSTYMIIGAIFGSLGAASYGFQNKFPIHHFWFIIGNTALILLGLHLLGVTWSQFIPNFISNSFSKLLTSFSKLITPKVEKIAQYPFLTGMAWGALPCGLLFGIAPFAIFSGAAWSGALLMLIFGLTALPHLLLSQSLITLVKKHLVAKFFKIIISLLLIALGIVGFWYANMNAMPDFLCIIP
jgi:sulfite exporter TauE/SafE